LDHSVYMEMLLVYLNAEADDQESGSDSDVDEHDLDNEGGDLGAEECDKLDEQMWGSDDEDPIKVRANLLLFYVCCCLQP